MVKVTIVERIYQHLDVADPRCADTLAALAGCSASAARRALKALREAGKAKVKVRRPGKPSGILHMHCKKAPRKLVDHWVMV